MKLAASILATALCAVLPLTAIASDHGSSGGGGGSHASSSGGGGGSHASSGGGSSSHAATPAQPARVAPAPPVRTAPIVRPPGKTLQPLPIYQARKPMNPPANGGHPVPNPNTYPAWGWNGDTAWVGFDGYWGNGFWGPLAYGLDAAAYIVANGSPGAKLLQAYDLRQTPCGPPDLVEIFGPDGSEVCAYPNALVAPGQYYVDPATLTLYSGPPQIDDTN
jgi:hypothetical protein